MADYSAALETAAKGVFCKTRTMRATSAQSIADLERFIVSVSASLKRYSRLSHPDVVCVLLGRFRISFSEYLRVYPM